MIRMQNWVWNWLLTIDWNEAKWSWNGHLKNIKIWAWYWTLLCYFNTFNINLYSGTLTLSKVVLWSLNTFFSTLPEKWTWNSPKMYLRLDQKTIQNTEEPLIYFVPKLMNQFSHRSWGGTKKWILWLGTCNDCVFFWVCGKWSTFFTDKIYGSQRISTINVIKMATYWTFSPPLCAWLISKTKKCQTNRFTLRKNLW